MFEEDTRGVMEEAVVLCRSIEIFTATKFL